MKWMACLMVFICLGGTAGAQGLPVFSLPETEREDLLNRVRAHFLPETLPMNSPHRLEHAVCGTTTLMGLLQHGHELPQEIRQKTAVLLQRPALDLSTVSPSGHIRIHYTLSGQDAVSSVDADGNGIPDYVDEAVRAFDAAWDLQINQLGYNPPPSDGDGVYDVYIKNLGLQGAYGFTYPIAWPANVTPSYIEIDNNFTDVIYQTRGLDGLRVTAAHEFFHAVQFGYYANFGAAWWQEMTAVWMEDVAYPDIDDYYQYLTCAAGLNCFFDTPELSLDYFSGSLKPFGGAVYAHHLAKAYGAGSVRNVWEELHRSNPPSYNLTHIDRGMPLGGFAGIMPRFYAWNYLTAARTRPGYYPSAADYPSVKYPTVNLSSGGSLSGSARVSYLGATYIPVRTSNLSGGLRAAFTLATGGEWKLMVMLLSAGKVELLWPASTTVVIPNVNRFQEVVFVPMVTSLSGTQLLASYALSSGTAHATATDLVADFSGDGRVDFADFIAFAEGFGRSHTDAKYNARLDLNGDGPVDFTDFLMFVSHFGTVR